jgi:hypothetical protein
MFLQNIGIHLPDRTASCSKYGRDKYPRIRYSRRKLQQKPMRNKEERGKRANNILLLMQIEKRQSCPCA